MSAVPTPVLAVSVIPVSRDADGGVQVFVQHRAATMDFAAGAVVFPGGRVNEEDHAGVEVPPELVQAHARVWSRGSIGDDPAALTRMTQVLLRCARREVAEETGWELEVADLIPWANWVTPPTRPKRFDTYFFLARVEDLDALGHQTTEATNSQWRRVDWLLARYDEGQVRLMRPTLELLRGLAGVGDVGVLQTPGEPIEPVRPEVHEDY